jgi:hypothetical protein
VPAGKLSFVAWALPPAVGRYDGAEPDEHGGEPGGLNRPITGAHRYYSTDFILGTSMTAGNLMGMSDGRCGLNRPIAGARCAQVLNTILT